jgi:hypothetical protein
MDIKEIIGLFADTQPLECEIKNTSHGEDDFREAVILRWEKGVLPAELGDRMVIKLAANGFTDPVHLEMWERLAEEYRRRGYWCPRFLRTRAGEFPFLEYKGRRCLVYGEEFAPFPTADRFDPAVISPNGRFTYLDDLLRMNAEIAAAHFDFTDLPSGWVLFGIFDPMDTEDEVMEDAHAWLACAEKLPEAYQTQVRRIWDRWMKNRAYLQKEYHRLPTSVFQADLNSTNILLDENGSFAGIMDFNIAGRETFLNYLFREVPYIYGKRTSQPEPNAAPEDDRLARICYALNVVKERYTFSEAEKELALPLYRCLCPLWYTDVERLKAAKNEEELQAALDDAERLQTMEIDFRAAME